VATSLSKFLFDTIASAIIELAIIIIYLNSNGIEDV
jgi:hypothetical protein